MQKLLILFSIYLLYSYAASVGECTAKCNDLRTQVLTLQICKEAKKTLPRPKVGDVCSVAMEQGFSDVCVPLCMGESPTNRMAQACRAAAAEMPRPTVRRWCEHGYKTAYSKSQTDLKQTFTISSSSESTTPVQETKKPEPIQSTPERKLPETKTNVKNVIAKIPINIGEDVYDLEIHDTDNLEVVVQSFCEEKLPDDVVECVEDLLPTVVQRMAMK